jgi:hypothetical protein
MAYRPRLWHVLVFLVLFSALGMVMAGALHHRQGLKQVRELCEARQSAGLVGSLADALAILPPSDDSLQARWLAWSNTSLGTWTDPKYSSKDVIAWVAATGPYPQAIADTVAARAHNFDEAREMLANPALLLSGAGWIRTHLLDEKFTLLQAAALPIPNLLVQRELAQWLHHAAVLADDPRPYLTDFDALIHASRYPVTLIDAMTLVAVINIHDQAYVECALRGTLPDDLRETWLSAPMVTMAQTGAGILHEGLLFGLGTANWLEQSQFSWNNAAAIGSTSAWLPFDVWWHGTHDAARIMAYEYAAHDRLAGLTTGPLPTTSSTYGRGGLLLGMLLPNVLESAMTALETEAHQRACRVAVLLITAPPGSDLPSDTASLLQTPRTLDLVQPSGDAYHLAYERLSPTRFRIGIAPTTPVPDFVDASRIPPLSKAWGTSPSKEPLVLGRGGPIEVELPQRK